MLKYIENRKDDEVQFDFHSNGTWHKAIKKWRRNLCWCKHILKLNWKSQVLDKHKSKNYNKRRSHKPFYGRAKVSHWKALKRILRYVKDTMSFGWLYTKSDNYRLSGNLDTDWCRDMNDQKRIIDYVFFMGDISFTWLSKK